MPATTSGASWLSQLADACVQCGLCLPHCPTYLDAGNELESPRGRILLARALSEGRIEPRAADAGQALSHCLGCRACEAVCPAKVEYGRILHLTRAHLRRANPPPVWQRLAEWMVARPRWLGLAFGAARALRRLPALRRRLPPVPAARPLRDAADLHAPRGRLLLVQGCVATHWERPAHEAALKLLSALGWQVRVLAPSCCGALHRHSGSTDAAVRLRDTLARAIETAGCEAVVHAGSGCHEAIREAAAPLPTHELCAFIADDANLGSLRFRPSSRRVAIHIACTQRNVVRHGEAERALLRRVPGLSLAQDAPSGCCGAAGVQSLRFPDQSAQRMTALRHWYREAAPELLLAGNLGCRLQLARELGGASDTLPVQHPLEFLVEHLQ